jgi:hypothetical protein
MNKIKWPLGKSFAFTIFDDTDLSESGNFEIVYDFLADLGMKTTKSVWPIRGENTPKIGGATCEDPVYLSSVVRMQKKGFEIGYHNSTYHGVSRERIEKGLEKFRAHFGHYPRTMSNHADSVEAIYWGDSRLTGWRKKFYNLVTRNRQKEVFLGHVKGSTQFWGDLCLEKISYVRNFVTADINTLKFCPWMPYHDPTKPYVKYWYASSEGPMINSFNETTREESQDRLEEEGGACIMYTHVACGFQENGKLNPRFRELMTRLAGKNGWFVPVGELLDFLLTQSKNRELTPAQRAKLERRWLMHKIRIGGTS